MTKTPRSSKCSECGRKIPEGILFCSHKCFEIFDLKKQLNKIKSHLCAECNGNLGITRHGACGQYCCEECEDKAIIKRERKERAVKTKIQKYEKIEKMAWVLFSKYLFDTVKNFKGKAILVTAKMCWEEAEIFCDYAKQKQEESEND